MLLRFYPLRLKAQNDGLTTGIFGVGLCNSGCCARHNTCDICGVIIAGILTVLYCPQVKFEVNLTSIYWAKVAVFDTIQGVELT